MQRRTLNDTAMGEPNVTLGTDVKYAAFNQVGFTQLRADLDGFSYTLAAAGTSAANLFASTTTPIPDPMSTPEYPAQPIESDPNFDFQPNCHYFGINTNFGGNTAVRFGFTANENAATGGNVTDCTSNDTGNGLGLLVNNAGMGSGFVCNYPPCTLYSATATNDNGAASTTHDTGATGLLWVK